MLAVTGFAAGYGARDRAAASPVGRGGRERGAFGRVGVGVSRSRLLGFDARDADGRTVKRSGADRLARVMLTAVPGAVGGEVAAAVRAFSPQ